jgi:hypothetical protein
MSLNTYNNMYVCILLPLHLDLGLKIYLHSCQLHVYVFYRIGYMFTYKNFISIQPHCTILGLHCTSFWLFLKNIASKKNFCITFHLNSEPN